MERYLLIEMFADHKLHTIKIDGKTVEQVDHLKIWGRL